MSKKSKISSLKVKRAFLFFLCFLFFFVPGQNWYAVAQTNYQFSPIRDLNFSLPPSADYPVNLNKISMPNLTARALIVIDHDSAVVLESRNQQLRVLPASTVKLMTALVVFDNYSLKDVLTVGPIEKNGQGIDLIKGEKMTVRNLLYGLLVASGNDAALVLAQNYPGGEKNFVDAMNQKAQALNLKSTYFANPTGLDSDKEGKILTDFSYTTALDLAHLAAYALQNETLRQIVSTKEIMISDITGRGIHKLYNVNELLDKLSGMKGLKTGWTEEAGECLIGYTERDNRGIITVILGSQDRFGETE
ncbi:MAG: serine hydrolase, partial [Candidatus Shapirobacteria bacterium]|nr:serine hydrolase [Candidatus Shapirobacteria bacterium]